LVASLYCTFDTDGETFYSSEILQMHCIAIKITIVGMYHGPVDEMRQFDPFRRFLLLRN